MSRRRDMFSTEEALHEVMLDADSGGESDFELESDSDSDTGEDGIVDRGRANNIDSVHNDGRPARKRARTVHVVGDDGSLADPIFDADDDDDFGNDDDADGNSDDDNGDDGGDNDDNPQPRHWVRQPRWHGIQNGAYKDVMWLQAFTEQCGVLLHEPEATPEEIFGSLFPQEAIQLLVQETNRYADQYFRSIGGKENLPPKSPARKWKDVTERDISSFIGLILFMGLVRLPTYAMYWSNCWLLDLGMKSVISRDRFLLIMRFLHCANNEAAPPRNDPGYSRIFKIKGLLDCVVGSWQQQYYPGRDITGDETVLPFKGTTSMKGYNPQKPHKWGLTVWSLAEAETGYVYNWNLYEGKNNNDDRTQNNDGRGKVHWVTWDLLESANVLGKNHHFYCDNYFSSPTLFEDLANRGTGACGTLRRNRVGVPDIIKKAKPTKTEPAVMAESGKCTFFSWQDRNLVNMVTTIHTTETFMKRTRSKNSVSGWQERDKPKAIECYTKYMRGVDLADQAMWYSLNTHKSVKWWKKVFIGLLEVCMCNALVIYRALNPGKAVDRNNFRLHVISKLIGGYTNRGSGGVQRGPIVQAGEDLGHLARALALRFQPGPHFPELTQKKTAKGQTSRPRCIVCSPTGAKRVQTMYQCAVCKVPLCPAPCMTRFHTIEVSWRKPRSEMNE